MTRARRNLLIAVVCFGLPAVPAVWKLSKPPGPPSVERCAPVVWVEARGWVQQPVSPPCQARCGEGSAWYEVAGLCRCQGEAPGAAPAWNGAAACEGNVYVPRGACSADVLLEWPGGQRVVAPETCVLLARTEGLTARCYESQTQRSSAPVEPLPRAPCL